MLQRILQAIVKGEAVSQQGLARVLGVTEGLVAPMVQQLVAQGYLTEAALCGDGCDGCGLQAACGSDRALRLWTVTEKGRRAAGRGRPAPV